MRQNHYHFDVNELIDDQYTVTSFIATEDYAQTYRVRNPDFQAKVLKLFIGDGSDELAVLSRLDHANVVRLEHSDELELAGQRYRYAILDFVHGESLIERKQREDPLSVIGAKSIFLGIIEGLIYLARIRPSVLHNRLLPQNIILNHASHASIPVIANFSFSGGQPIHYDDKDKYFVAPEAIANDVSVSADIYAAAANCYYLLHDYPPFSAGAGHRPQEESAILQNKQSLVAIDEALELPDSLVYIITKAMHPELDKRYHDPVEVRKDLYMDPSDPSFSERLALLRS